MNTAPPSALPPLSRRRALLLGGLLAGTAALALPLKPERLLAADVPRIDLDALVPSRFGAWRVDTSLVPLQPSPDVLQKIEAIYDATLARTYIDTRGRRVMLSIAYGGDQTGRLRAHRPESCYSAQGFAVRKLRDEVLHVGTHAVPMSRLNAKLGTRSEPISYWIRVGSRAVSGQIGQRLAQLRYGLTGDVPDGLIFRMSSIERQPEVAFQVHDAFVADLLGVLDAASIERLIGRPSAAA